MSTKKVFTFPPTEPIVSMVTFRDYIVVATAFCLYRVTHDDVLELKVELQEIVEVDP